MLANKFQELYDLRQLSGSEWRKFKKRQDKTYHKVWLINSRDDTAWDQDQAIQDQDTMSSPTSGLKPDICGL